MLSMMTTSSFDNVGSNVDCKYSTNFSAVVPPVYVVYAVSPFIRTEHKMVVLQGVFTGVESTARLLRGALA